MTLAVAAMRAIVLTDLAKQWKALATLAAGLAIYLVLRFVAERLFPAPIAYRRFEVAYTDLRRGRQVLAAPRLARHHGRVVALCIAFLIVVGISIGIGVVLGARGTAKPSPPSRPQTAIVTATPTAKAIDNNGGTKSSGNGLDGISGLITSVGTLLIGVGTIMTARASRKRQE